MQFGNVLDHTFCTSLLADSPNPVVVDCGSNRGEFARHCAERLGASVVSYEADPEVAARLPTIPGVTFVNAAVAGRPGTIEIRRSPGTCSSIRFHAATGSPTAQVPAVTFQQILDAHGLDTVDLLKLDIEGAELDVFEQTPVDTLARCAQITCEFHDFLDPGDLPRIRRILRSLRNDFIVVSLSVFNYGDVLFVNRRAIRGRPGVRLQILAHKYAVGVRRLARRILGMRR